TGSRLPALQAAVAVPANYRMFGPCPRVMGGSTEDPKRVSAWLRPAAQGQHKNEFERSSGELQEKRRGYFFIENVCVCLCDLCASARNSSNSSCAQRRRDRRETRKKAFLQSTAMIH